MLKVRLAFNTYLNKISKLEKDVIKITNYAQYLYFLRNTK